MNITCLMLAATLSTGVQIPAGGVPMNGGSVIQFTVFSAEELRDAQAHPERYENLQVRVCGWNVRWNDLSKAEQDTYICRAENIMQDR